MSVRAVMGELEARLRLADRAPTLLLVIAPSDAIVDEMRGWLLAVLRSTPLALEDLGTCTNSMGPARWAEATKAHAEVDGHLLSFTPSTALEARAFAHLLNAERQLLQDLAGPVLLVVSRQTEAAIRKYAHDFFTWVARSYELAEPRELQAMAAKLDPAPAAGSPVVLEQEPPVRFLHVSDLHLRPGRVKRYDQDRVLRGLVEFLERDRAEAPLDLIFVTGDLAFSGKATEYALVVELLRELLRVTGVPAEHVFVVPGNHDVDRRVGRWLLRTLESDEDAVAFFEESDARDAHRRKLDAYEGALRPLLGDTRALGLGVGRDAVELVEIRGTRLAVASFNSSWFSQGDSDEGQLWLGEPNVSRALDRIADEEAAFAVALLHHPFDYLHERERRLVEHWFERGFDLVLRGHLHADETRSIASQRGGYVEVAAPAAYQGSHWPNGCFLGEIRAKARTVRLRPYQFAAGPDPWVLDAKVFPDDAEDGYCRTFIVPPKRRRKSGIAAAVRGAVRKAYETATPQQQREVQRSVLTRGATDEDDRHTAHETMLLLADEPPEVRKALLGKHDPGLALLSAIESSSEASAGKLDVREADGFEHALRRAGRLFLEHAAKLGLRRTRMPKETAVNGLAAALGLIVDAPIAFNYKRLQALPGHDELFDGYIDLVMGVLRLDTALIQVTRAPLAEKLRLFEQYLAKHADVWRGALVLLGSLSDDAVEPRVERHQAQSGHAIFVLHL